MISKNDFKKIAMSELINKFGLDYVRNNLGNIIATTSSKDSILSVAFYIFEDIGKINVYINNRIVNEEKHFPTLLMQVDIDQKTGSIKEFHSCLS